MRVELQAGGQQNERTFSRSPQKTLTLDYSAAFAAFSVECAWNCKRADEKNDRQTLEKSVFAFDLTSRDRVGWSPCSYLTLHHETGQVGGIACLKGIVEARTPMATISEDKIVENETLNGKARHSTNGKAQNSTRTKRATRTAARTKRAISVDFSLDNRNLRRSWVITSLVLLVFSATAATAIPVLTGNPLVAGPAIFVFVGVLGLNRIVLMWLSTSDERKKVPLREPLVNLLIAWLQRNFSNKSPPTKRSRDGPSDEARGNGDFS